MASWLLGPRPGVATALGALAMIGAAAPAAGAPAVVVEGAPGSGCPASADVAGALTAQLGADAVADDAGWRLVHGGREERATGGGANGRDTVVRLELRDDQGRPRLEREVRAPAGDCRAVAQAMALIVYRYFADLGWTAGRPLPSPAALPPVAAASTIAAATPAPPAAGTRLVLEAGAGLWTRRPGVGTAMVGARLEWRRVEVALALLAPGASARERRADGGEAEVTAWAVALGAGAGWERGALRLHAGPLALVSREWGRSRGIPVPRENTAMTGSLGAAAGVAWRVWGGWRVGVEGWAAHALLGDRFVVEGWGPVLAPPRVQGVVLARVAYGFSP